MPKILQYPRTSFDKSIEIAETAYDLGGSCNEETCAEKLGKKVSGGFKSILASAQKFGLIEFHKGLITVTEAYKLIVHSYSEEEKKLKMAEAFLSPQVFNDLYNRFVDKKLPVDLLEKMLIREYGVESNLASRVSKYFIDGLKSLDLLDSANIVRSINHEEVNNIEEEDVQETNDVPLTDNNKAKIDPPKYSVNQSAFTIHMYGPGLDTKIEVGEEDDIMIVEATLRKIKKKLNEMEGNSNKSGEPS